MEVKPGYKQTELGVIPEDWQVDCLSRFWTVIDCKHITAHFVANGYPIASIQEVAHRFVELVYAKQTTQKFYALLIEGGRKPRAGDLIMSRNATVGDIGQVSESHPPFAMGQDVCLLRKRFREFSTDYLQAVFRSPIIANQLSDLMVGSTFKRVNVQQIRNFSVPMPQPAEQKAIADALSDTDAHIESLEQLIAKKRNLKQGAMQELLRPKDEWATECLGLLFHLSAGHPKSGVLNETGDFIVMDMGAVSSDGKILISKRTNLKEDILHHGDLVMPKDDIGGGQIIGKVAFIDSDNQYVLGDHVYRLQKIGSRLESLFFYFLINSRYVNQELKKKVAGSAQLGLGRASVLEQSVTFPDEPVEQTTIAAILSDMDAEIGALEAKLNKARQLKQGMMQELLTGSIRLI